MRRVQQWDATVGALVALQAAYAAWLDALPEATLAKPCRPSSSSTWMNSSGRD